jgi:hypothetical protein
MFAARTTLRESTFNQRSSYKFRNIRKHRRLGAVVKMRGVELDNGSVDAQCMRLAYQQFLLEARDIFYSILCRMPAPRL